MLHVTIFRKFVCNIINVSVGYGIFFLVVPNSVDLNLILSPSGITMRIIYHSGALNYTQERTHFRNQSSRDGRLIHKIMIRICESPYYIIIHKFTILLSWDVNVIWVRRGFGPTSLSNPGTLRV